MNPFLQLGGAKPKGEEVEGAFTCLEDDCWSTVKTARYVDKEQTLTWYCEKEHENILEGFKLDG